ncbi:MAG TPA: hypothetical protein PLI09_21555 [Candidatus Hydrogenedentes bacterium]|nr:hypothetical protein [Candidatus Hydrogenedentota bacterium]
MEYPEIQDVVLDIVQSAEGRFLLPYQIYKEIQRTNPELAQRLEQAYPVTPGNPIMGRNAGIYYSPASFIAHALDYYLQHGENIRKEWINPRDVFIDEIKAGNEKALSIWASRP